MLDRRADRIGVVVSAMGGMTDALLNLAQLAVRDDDTYEAELAVIGERYSTTTSELLDGKQKAAVLDAWSKDADENPRRSVAAMWWRVTERSGLHACSRPCSPQWHRDGVAPGSMPATS
jgi:aspartokinase